MSGEVQFKKASEINAPGGAQTEGMIRMNAITDTSEQICGTDTIVYATQGHGVIVSGPNGSKRQELSPGDFAFIHAYTEHQEVNESDEDVLWIITRSGRNPIAENLEGWGGS